MSVLVAYASKHGATQGIAERVAETLVAGGQDATVLPVSAVADPSRYSAFVIGGAVYVGKWRKEAVDFVRHNSALLATRPVWLFSSGPLGTKTQDAQGRDLLEAAKPAVFAEFAESIAPQDLTVFYGALDPQEHDRGAWLLRRLPAGRDLLPEGDFRNWDVIAAWAERIARELSAPTNAT
jgi:menaquinone-dependent protoporphyrinogen oxidase